MQNCAERLEEMKKECANYGKYQVRIRFLKDRIRLKRAGSESCEKEIRQLERVSRKIRRVEHIFDHIERSEGIEKRMLLWRALIGHEDLDALARERNMDPSALEMDIDTCLFEIIVDRMRMTGGRAYA